MPLEGLGVRVGALARPRMTLGRSQWTPCPTSGRRPTSQDGALLGNVWDDSRPILADSGPHAADSGPSSDDSGPSLADSWTDSEPNSSISGHIWPIRANFGRLRSEPCQTGANFGRFRATCDKFGRSRPKFGANSAEFGPKLAESARIWPNSGQSRPSAESGQCGPHLADSGPNLADSGPWHL